MAVDSKHLLVNEMKKEEILKKIKKAALRDRQMRRDPRFVKTLSFLTTKGFLFTNQNLPKAPNLHLQIDDAIWAGKNLEPRILEVLPAAVLRLGKHFDYAPDRHRELAETLNDLRANKAVGHDFQGIPYEKLKVWVNLDLKDGRIKTLKEKRISKNFRLRPQTIDKLEKLAKKSRKNITAILEDLVENK
jgi:hypothetical protein